MIYSVPEIFTDLIILATHFAIHSKSGSMRVQQELGKKEFKKR